MLISPFNTLKNWGSSSKFVRLRKVPRRVRRGSSGVVQRVSLSCGSPTRIVRNLYIRNTRPFKPTRSCTKRAGPGDVNRIATAMTAIGAEQNQSGRREDQVK